jgi:hypothetical protein
MAIEARKAGLKSMILTLENAAEAAIVSDLQVYGLGISRRSLIF